MLVAIALAVLDAASARALTVTEYPTPVPGARPGALAVAPDGDVWYSAGEDINGDGAGGPHIGRLDPSTMRVQTFPLAAQYPLVDLVGVPSGTLWGVTYDSAERWGLAHIDPGSGVVGIGWSEHPYGGPSALATGGGRLFGLIVNPDAGQPSQLVEIDPATGATRPLAQSQPFPVPAQGAIPAYTGYALFDGLAATPAGVVWTLEHWREASGGAFVDRTWAVRVDPAAGTVTRYALPASGELAAGPGDEAWILGQDSLLHVTAANGRADSTASPPGWLTFPVVVGNGMWVGDGSAIDRIDLPSMHVTKIDPLTGGGSLLGLTVAPDGAIWARQADSDSLLRITDDTGPATANAAAALRRGVTAATDCTAACSGTASLSVRVASGGGQARAAAAGRARRLGRARFHLRAAGHVAAQIRISPRTRRWLRSRRTWRATILVRVRTGRRHTSRRRAVILRFYPKFRGGH